MSDDKGSERQYDVIVVGSGFGGAVSACRLSEAGKKVLVLERGRRWETKDFPSVTGGRDIVFDSYDPLTRNGWFEFHIFRRMVVATAAGVGGGSLVYANVSAIPPPHAFETGWPPEITYDGLQSHYSRVGQMLELEQIPDGQLTARLKLMEEAATAVGDEQRFTKIDLAMRFDPQWNYGLEDPFAYAHSKRVRNQFGREQGTCVHCGNCDLGCPVGARNTLDLNYLAVAEDKGAEIRPLHIVRHVAPAKTGYEVVFERLDRDTRRLVPGRVSAPVVVLSAGSLGSTDLLLRSRDHYRTLPRVSSRLGHNWSANGNFLTPASYRTEGNGRVVSPTHGPTITCHIDYLDGARSGGLRYTVEDGGIAPLLRDYLQDWLNPGVPRRLRRVPRLKLRHPHFIRGELLKLFAASSFRKWTRTLQGDDELQHVMPWFGNGVDASDGRMYLGRYWYSFWKKSLKMDWNPAASRAMYDALIARHTELSAETGGRTWVPPTWTLLHDLITPHPLGGCSMGTSAQNGVVDHRGEVFGYPGLYVLDGSIVPHAIGINPSRTIAALAERNVALLIDSIGAGPG